MADSVDPATLGDHFRFGWALAETRGRLLQGEPAPAPRWPEHALPLESERSWTEQTIETRHVLRALAEGLQLDRPLRELSGQGRSTAATAMARLTELREDVEKAGTTGALDVALEFLYAWDARIQDILAPLSFSLAGAYQLGRGLAETYWALHPAAADDDPLGWRGYLFGDERIEALKRLLWALAGPFRPAPVDALPAALDAWAALARDADGSVRRDPLTYRALRTQIGIWHDVLLVGQPPQTRVTSADLLQRARRMRPVLRAFLPEAALATLGLAAAVVGAALFAAGGVAPELAPALAVLGGLGITGAGALASAKNQAHSLFAELQQAMRADAVEEALTSAPADAYLGVSTSEASRRRARRRAQKELRELRAAAAEPAKATG